MSTRQDKVGRLIQKELGNYFQREIQNLYPGGMITVTIVRMTADLSIARVHLSIFPSKNKDEIFENIQQNGKLIKQYLVGKIKSQLRKMPEINFFIDDSLDYIDNIDKLLSK